MPPALIPHKPSRLAARYFSREPRNARDGRWKIWKCGSLTGVWDEPELSRTSARFTSISEWKMLNRQVSTLLYAQNFSEIALNYFIRLLLGSFDRRVHEVAYIWKKNCTLLVWFYCNCNFCDISVSSVLNYQIINYESALIRTGRKNLKTKRARWYVVWHCDVCCSRVYTKTRGQFNDAQMMRLN